MYLRFNILTLIERGFCHEFFASEIKKKIVEEYKYRIEMHAHTTPASSCGDIPPEDVIKKYKEIGYDGVVITNHFIYDYNLYKMYSPEEALKKYTEDYLKAKEVGEKLGLTVLLGAEIRFTENINDYLLYGVDEEMFSEIYEMLPYGLENFRKNFNMKKSLLFQAHPFRNDMTLADPKLLDGIETFNMHLNHNGRVAQAVKYAAENNINLTIAGTDYHHLGMDGLAAVRTKKMPKTSFELAELLKTGDYVMEIGGNAIVLP